MKKYLVIVAAVSFMAACGNNESASTDTENTEATADNSAGDMSSNPDYQKGLDLVASSDCYTCHKTEEKLVGPAYVDVANKYAGSDTAVAYLSHKIITGGSGVWGEVAMTPHPQVSQADAEQMVKYILLLKNK